MLLVSAYFVKIQLQVSVHGTLFRTVAAAHCASSKQLWALGLIRLALLSNRPRGED